MESLETLTTIGGIIGVVLMVVAYYLISTEQVNGRSVVFHGLNFVGASLVLVSLLFDWNLPAFIIECVWVAISAFGLLRSWRLHHKGA